MAPASPRASDDLVWLFPGQGAQSNEMWSAFAAGETLMEQAGDIVGENLVDRCRSEPARTWPGAVLQPAMLATCIAAMRELASDGAEPAAVLGHSLGEYAALVAAGSMAFPDAVRVVRTRGEAMDHSTGITAGGMLAVLGLGAEDVELICAEVGEVWPANYNAPGQVVVSGRLKSLQRAAERFRGLGARALIPLDVPAATHTPLMQPAMEQVRAELRGCRLDPPRFPFYSCVDGTRHSEPERIRLLLEKAIVMPVRFADAVREVISEGAEAFVEVGPGKVLSRLVKHVNADVEVSSLRAWLRRHPGAPRPVRVRA